MKKNLQNEVMTLEDKVMQDRIIFLTGEINQQSAYEIKIKMFYLESLNHEPIKMYINSPGGCVASTLALYDVINIIKSPVHTYVCGMAASGASVLACAGAAGNRNASPSSKFLTHQPRLYFEGMIKAVDTLDLYENMLTSNDLIRKIYKEAIDKSLSLRDAKGDEFNYSKNSMKEVDNMLKRELFISAQEAKKLGLIDQIIPSKSTIFNENITANS